MVDTPIPASSDRMTVIYARTSTSDQKTGLESQVRALKEYCEKNKITNFRLFSDDGISGTKNSRPELDAMMKLVREGNVEKVVVYSFSRYARSVSHLLSALEEFKIYKTSFISLTENIDTDSALGKAFFVIISAISQLERDILVERLKNGLKNARAKGRQIGRKKTRPSEMIRAMLKKGLPQRTIASICGTSNRSISLEKKIWLQEEREAKRAKEKEKVLVQQAGGLHVLDESMPW